MALGSCCRCRVGPGLIVKPPPELSSQFHEQAMRRERPVPFIAEAPACWLASFDPLKRLCKGKWEAFHFFGKQELRNCPELRGLTPEELMLIEWDARNAGPGCVEHHRRFDNLADAGPGSALVVPRSSLPADVEEFIAERGIPCLAERRFPLC